MKLLFFTATLILFSIFVSFFYHYQIYPFDHYKKAFSYIDANVQKRQAFHENGNVDKSIYHWSKQKERGLTINENSVYQGYISISKTADSNLELLDNNGRLIYSWDTDFYRLFDEASHIETPVKSENIYVFRDYIYPNGDAIILYQATDTPRGYGLAKINKESELIWRLEQHAHHDFDIDDEGNIFVLTEKIEQDNIYDIETLPVPFMDEFLVKLTPEGEVIKKLPIYQILKNSNFMHFFETLDDPDGDFLHSNTVNIVGEKAASHHDFIEADQILLSFRNLDTIAILDFDKEEIVWAAKGPWVMQHEPQFLDNGNIIIYDNHFNEEIMGKKASRIIEFDPVTKKADWVYSGFHDGEFYSDFAGFQQRLPNGNTLIVDTWGKSRVFEVNQEKQIIWEYLVPADERGLAKRLTYSKKYDIDYFEFLKEDND